MMSIEVVMAACKFKEVRGPLTCSSLFARMCIALVLGACSGANENEPSTDLDSTENAMPGNTTGDSATGSGSDSAAPMATSTSSAQPSPAASPTSDESTSVEPLNPARASFRDPDSSFVTQDVHDAEREVVHFDVERSAMVSDISEDSVSGWATDGNELRWSRSGVAFRVRFGTEAGERRAYFTEAGNGTICNLEIDAPDTLRIFATSEVPPQ